MKKVIYFGTIVISMFMFIGGVNAANYTEGNWVQTTDNCGEYSDVANSYTSYTFDANAGTFNLTGSSYSESMSGGGERMYVFYTTSSDQKTLYAYIPSYNSNVSLIDSSLGIPAGSCELIYRVSKEAISDSTDNITGDSTDNTTDDTNTDVSGDQTNNNEQDDYQDYEDEPSDFFPGVGDGEDYDTNDESSAVKDDVKTENNPNTGLSDYIFYFVPLFLIGGVVLVLKKNKILGM